MLLDSGVAIRGIVPGMDGYLFCFGISLVSMILGTQLSLAGLLGDLITRTSSERNVYLIDKEL